jgi:hypothetical protein
MDVDIDWFTIDFNQELSALHGGMQGVGFRV